MRLRYLLLTAVIGLTFPNVLSAQVTKYLLSTTADSLVGFDEAYHSAAASGEGLSGVNFVEYMAGQQRAYINEKYYLGEHYGVTPPTMNYFKPLGGGASVNNAPCNNEDFENSTSGSFAGWTAYRGRNVSSNVIPTFTASNLGVGAQVSVVTTPYSDNIVGIIPHSPLGGTKVIRLNNTNTNNSGPAIKLRQTFSVTPTNYLFSFAYWAVMENAASPPNTPHTCTQTPYMSVRIRDFNDTLQSCPNFSFAAPATGTGGCAGTGPATWSAVAGTSSLVMTSVGWQRFAINLAGYMNQNVSVEVVVAHCTLWGHYGYGYFDSHCGTMDVKVNGTDFSLLNTPTTATALCGNSATMIAPTGLGPYTWNGPSGSGIINNTSQTIVTTVPGGYTLSMNPPGICNLSSRVINLSFVPPTTVTASPATICTSGSNTVSTLTASGATNYTWLPFGSTGSTRTVSPAATTIYTLIAQTGTCIGTYTVQVTVAPDPNVTINSSSPTQCNGSSTTLTAQGANSYVWMPGSMTNSQVIVNPSSTTIYTVTGTGAGGCTASATVQVSVSTFTVDIFTTTTGTICAGSPVMVIGLGLGASSYSWYPTSPLLTGQIVTLNPTITTQYTLVGTNGTCTNSATHVFTVDPGPTITITASPTITCPGVNATLTAIAPASLGFTWNPGASTGSSLVVNPNVSTVYSVTGINASGCRSTYTINKPVAPLPVIAFLPATPTVCIGSARTLTATGGTSYTWMPGPVFTNTISVNPTVNTAFTVTASNGTCSSTNSVMVTVVPLPTVNATASPTAICRGNSALLQGSGATSYTWQPNGSFGANAIVSPTQTTTYTLTGSSAGCASTKTVMVVVNPLPTITPVATPTAVCPGFCSTLSATGANTYTFSSGAVVCPTGTSVYTVTGTSTANCVGAQATVQVIVNPVPAISLSPSSPSICAGGNINVTATGALAYTWNPGNLNGATQNLAPTSTTIYTVTGANAQGCRGTNTVQVLVVPNPIVNASAAPAVVCAGSSSTLSATGASSYLWLPGSVPGGTITVTPLSTTVFTVTGSTAGCSNTRTVSVTVNPRPTVSVSANPSSICAGACSTLNPSGALSYTYLPAGPIVCPTLTTTYSVTGVNAFGCTNLFPATVAVVVNPAANFTVSASSSSICSGNSVTLTASGVTSYNWLPGNLSGSPVVVTPSVTTTYTATGSTGSGCSGTRTITIIVVTTPTVTASPTSTSICPGRNATLTASGASSFIWNPGNIPGSPVVVAPLANTIYTVTGTTGGCSSTATAAVNLSPVPAVTASSIPANLCAGSCATLIPSGASTYTWTGLGGINPVVCPTVTTSYTVTGTNASGCTNWDSVTVNVTNPPSISASASSSSICAGSSATLIASGGSSYVWSPGSISGNPIVVIPSGTTVYTVTGTGAGGCTGTATILITVVPVPVVSVTANPAAICPGGSSTLTASGAAAYSWSGSSSTGNIIIVFPSVTTVYSVTGTTSGCASITRTVQVTVNPAPTINAGANPSNICLSACTTLSATGGTSYIWIPGSLSGNTIQVCPTLSTTYTVTGSNAFGCTGTSQVAVTVNNPPSLFISPTTNTICQGGSATFSASGASSYTWLPPNTNGPGLIVSPNSTTTYTLIGASASGCTSVATATVFVNPRPVVNLSANPSNTICAGSCATLTATGANVYTWSTGSSGSSVVICPASSNTVAVIGQNTLTGCTSTITSMNIFVNPLPVISRTATPAVICSGSSSTLTAGGASSYTWNPGTIINNPVVVTPLSTTIYTVRGTNANGCIGTNTVQILVNPTPTVIIIASSTSVCLGLPVILTAIGNGSTYAWQPGGMSTQIVTVSPNNTTTYTVTTTNSFGCSKTATITINVINPPSVTASSSPTSVCAGSCATLTASGATTYTWIPGFTSGATAVRCPSVTSSYTVVGQTGTCFSFAVVNVAVIPLPVIIASANPATICPGAVSTLSASGATSYTWNPGNMAGTSVTVSPVSNQQYTVVGATGACTNNAVTLVAVSSLPSVSITASSTSICAGGSVTLIGSGASTYSWSPGGSSSSAINVNPTSTTTYTLRGFNGLGCSSTTTITIFVQPLPPVTAAATQTNICSGNCSTLIASGANSYTWNPGNINGNTAQVCPTLTTTYIVTGAVGSCTANASVVVNVLNGPSATLSASSSTVCPGGSSTLTANSPGASSYSWSPIVSTASQVVVNPFTTTTYTVRIFSGFGCVTTRTVTVQVIPNPVVNIVGTTSLCAGQSTTLQATGANSYAWSPGSMSGSQVTVTPSSTTTYSVIGSSGGCNGTDTHQIVVIPNPIVTASATPSNLCSGGTTTLSATGANSYFWLPVNLSGSPISVQPSGSTIYTVNGTNVNGCTTQQTVAVIVSPSPSVNVSSSSPTICAGAQATLTASGMTTYTWLPGGLTTSAIVVNPSSTTVYTVFGSNGPGCNATNFFTQVVSPVPVVNVTASSTSVCAGFTTSLFASGANNYTWNPGGSNANPNMVVVSTTTTYTVDAESNGCATQAFILITAVPLPNIQASSNPTSVCLGNSIVLSATGANTYTWFPNAQSGAAISLTPAVTTQYTVVGFDSNNCPNFDTLTVPVLTVPQIQITPSSLSVCTGASGTLTASGALNYTWLPSFTPGPTLVISPSGPTTYTVIGDNGACSNDTTITIGILPLPVVTASLSPVQVCAGLPVTLTATGANNYTWQPINQIGNPVVDNPLAPTTYTVYGADLNGCVGSGFAHVAVDPAPVIVPVATPTGMCEGSLITVTLSVTGNATTYTWLPSGSSQTMITDNPVVTTIYTVSGTDNIGCIGTNTVLVGVFPIPTLAVSPLNSSICAGSSATLTATGATNYTWLPDGGNTSTAVVTPLSFTTYTLIGDNGGICMDTTTVNVFVNPLPANVSASVSGTITCASPTVLLFGSSTDTNVSYTWNGPLGYTSTDQNPTNVNVWGTFTLSVSDNVTGCVSSVTVEVPTDGSIPLVNATTTGSISCSGADVFINAVHTTTNPGYLWTGPQGFSATTQSANAPIAGDYTIVVTDLTSLCTGSAVVTVGTHTEVTVTATITAATCSLGVSLNDGAITVGNFGALDRFDLVAGNTYTGSLTYTSAITIPVSGIITNNLANPSTSIPYTLRIFDSLGCVKDFVLTLDPVDCTLRPMGIAKAVSTPTLNSDGTYKVSYMVRVTNYDSLALSSVILDDNLANTFPAPTTFTLGMSLAGNNGGLQFNPNFNGITDTKLTTTSQVPAHDTEFISFEVNITPNGFFGPFNNIVNGTALNGFSLPVSDISTEGDVPDPDNDSNPGNNSDPTILKLTPNVFFGLTKVGSFVKLDNNTYDVSYTVSVHNRGNDTLRNVVVNDSLFNNTIKSPASYSVKGAPVTTGGLVSNSSFDGRFNINLLDAASSKMAPGEVGTIRFTINVVPDTVTVVLNSAFGSAQSFFGDTARDVSNEGNNPDVNSNGIWNEPEDNVPTLLVLPLLTTTTHTLFIPEAFSPDGDGVNDLFVIKGLPEGGENSITIFNRWGNRVYHHGNYNNSWDGRPNIAGTLGKDRLPPGTYYYVIELKGPGVTKTGYIVLQY